MGNPATNGYVDLAGIKAADDLRVEEVDVPEWGGKVRLRQMPLSTMTAFLESNFELGKDGAKLKDREFFIELLSLTMVDADGKPVFNDRGHAKAILNNKSFAVVQRLATAASDLSAVDEKAVEKAKKG